MLGGGDYFLLSILPLYGFVFMMAHIFACIWFYLASISKEDKNWLRNFDYADD